MAGPTELILIACILLVVLLSVVPALVGAVDAAMRQNSVWLKANQNKVVWVIVLMLSPFAFPFAGVVAAAIYFGTIRPKLRRAANTAA